MMDFDEITRILGMMREHELTEFELERENFKLRIRKHGGGHWVAASYDRVIKSEVAAFETVDAIVETQTAGRQRIRYTRIMLPSQSADGTRWLLGASAMDNRIDLRLESA